MWRFSDFCVCISINILLLQIRSISLFWNLKLKIIGHKNFFVKEYSQSKVKHETKFYLIRPNRFYFEISLGAIQIVRSLFRVRGLKILFFSMASYISGHRRLIFKIEIFIEMPQFETLSFCPENFSKKWL